ncbi:MAG: hypothetical protein K6F71_10240 [Ruminococcus sp.]|uniref:hypothetical protein n=1 Tax=Ruminococcus sp. TaxID=41978 RepID=UPI0025EF5E57|nr:hypothetical protein [Ruminococcus sp.]MCR5541179.1 hypothetical protein [Ruminococcus sp.]
MAKYKFTPLDFYNYILLYDLRFSEQNRIIEDFFKAHNSELASTYRKDLSLLRKEINNIKICNTAIDGELDEVAVILNELKVKYKFTPQKEDYLFADYFKMLKLQLLYSGITYKKVKLRTILTKFGYKKRTEQVRKDLVNAINNLGLHPYLSKRAECEITKIPLDSIISFRLQ